MIFPISKVSTLTEGTRFTVIDFDGDKYRAVKEEGDYVFIYGKRRKRYGHRLTCSGSFSRLYKEIEMETPEETDKAWHKRIKRAIKCLEESGLWQNLLPTFKNLYKLSYSDKKEMEKLHWDTISLYSTIHNKRYADENADISAELEAINRVWAPWKAKYPFAFSVDEEGLPHVDTSYLYELSEVQFKSMYFGKYNNKRIKAEISDALKNHKKYEVYRLPVTYDVTFEYVPEDEKAWYSEEYRDCGNGHYYLALNHSTALFCEND